MSLVGTRLRVVLELVFFILLLDGDSILKSQTAADAIAISD